MLHAPDQSQRRAQFASVLLDFEAGALLGSLPGVHGPAASQPTLSPTSRTAASMSASMSALHPLPLASTSMSTSASPHRAGLHGQRSASRRLFLPTTAQPMPAAMHPMSEPTLDEGPRLPRWQPAPARGEVDTVSERLRGLESARVFRRQGLRRAWLAWRAQSGPGARWLRGHKQWRHKSLMTGWCALLRTTRSSSALACSLGRAREHRARRSLSAGWDALLRVLQSTTRLKLERATVLWMRHSLSVGWAAVLHAVLLAHPTALPITSPPYPHCTAHAARRAGCRLL